MTCAPARRLGAALTTLLLLAAGLAGCGTTDDPSAGPGAGAPGGEGWTVLVYSMADTDLEPFMVEDVNEAGLVGSSEGLQVRALVDRNPAYGRRPLLDQGDWVGGRVLDLTAPGTTEVVADLGDVNTADPQVLADFVAQGIADHPAEHYALILSDHGAGWPGLGPDESAAYDVLTLEELVDGIGTGLEEAGVDRLDLLGFDACLMAGYEVASAVAPLADRMVASQELEPGHGWDYRALQVLADEPGTDADGLGSALIDGFERQALEAGTQAEITLSMVDLTRMAELDAAVAAFAEEVSTTPEAAPVVGRAEVSVLSFGKSPDPAQDSHLSDLGLLASTVGQEVPALGEPAEALAAVLDEVVLDSVAGPATADATGLSVYLPPAEALLDEGYAEVDSASAWDPLLEGYYEAGSAIPEEELPAFVGGDEPDVSLAADGTLEVEATFADTALGNLTEAVISYGFVNEDGSVTYVGEEVALPFADTAEVYGSYDLTMLVLSDGEDEAVAYTDLDLNEDYTIGYLDVPLTYYPSYAPDQPQDALLSAVLDVEAGEFVSETLYGFDPLTEGYGELAPDPEGLLVPDVLTYTADGEAVWEPTTDVGLYADVAGLTYDFVPLDTGTLLQVDLTATDFGGNAATVGTVVEVP